MSEEAPAASLDDLVRAARATPEDLAARVRAARALDQAGRHREAAALLLERLVNVTAHEESALPPLARRGLDPALGSVRHDGETYLRMFAATPRHVLFFWAPEALREQQDALCGDVAERLAARLASGVALRSKR